MIDPRTYRWRVAPLPPTTMVEDPHLSSLRPAVTDIDDDGVVTMTGGTEEDAYYRLLAVLAEDNTTCYHTLERSDD